MHQKTTFRNKIAVYLVCLAGVCLFGLGVITSSFRNDSRIVKLSKYWLFDQPNSGI